MFDPKLYREACREITAPEDKIEEIIAMTEKTNRKQFRPLRTALVCAAAVAMMVVSVAAANPEEFQAFLIDVKSYVQVDRYRADVTMENGETFSMVQAPKAKVENRDGRAVLVVNGEDVADITEALSQEQHYVFEDISEDTKITITVNGTIDKWTMEKEVGIIKADGSYHWFGSENVTSEDVDDSLMGTFINGDPWSDRSVDVTDADVTYSMVVTTTSECEANK
ncbi:MAG: hypothetical protein K2P16_08105 [Lawsonibacter sp.]|jgi:hypothetical protein|nr:hypothetical protein [Lawsonibacter sp.]MCI9028555.1 hypothetical protein [Lawsonibacter sp.]MCI9295170.1 hypothetical protein [Lawsonibacter sp.]MCI9656700.1 hypothetical protein [Lawsonibacter sp.]MDE6899204.1 hypothetical protein [Lawsonibacter sp.]